jgi:GTP cyclohydrolase I
MSINSTINNNTQGKVIPLYNQPQAEGLYKSLLRELGEDVEREGLLETPKRHIKFLHEFTHPEPFNFTTFDAEGSTEMIVQARIPFYSLCEHHVIPFFGEAFVGYIPDGRIVGLSKLARTVKYKSSGLQNQERITAQVAQMIQDKLNPMGVGVILKARHMCMEMRGVQTCGTETTTTSFLGSFQITAVQQEFYRRIKC